MYLRNLAIENLGPIERLDLSLPFTTDGHPKPVVLVGANGSGKSITLAILANAMIAMQQVLYDNAEVAAGRVYKLRSQNYIRAGAKHYRAQARFDDELEVTEWQLSSTREEFEKTLDEPARTRRQAEPGWGAIPPDGTSTIDHSFPGKKPILRKIWSQQSMLYFPADRHELAAWLNDDDLKYRPKYATDPRLDGRTNRRIVRTVALKEVR
jgi:hypothetical protein